MAEESRKIFLVFYIFDISENIFIISVNFFNLFPISPLYVSEEEQMRAFLSCLQILLSAEASYVRNDDNSSIDNLILLRLVEKKKK